jgi:hypothetical protein
LISTHQSLARLQAGVTCLKVQYQPRYEFFAVVVLIRESRRPEASLLTRKLLALVSTSFCGWKVRTGSEISVTQSRGSVEGEFERVIERRGESGRSGRLDAEVNER